MTPTRVLLLSTYYHPVIGGAETAARSLATHLAARGCQVEVVTKRTARGLPDEDVVDGVPVHRIKPPGERSGAGKWRMLPYAAAELWARRSRYDVICCVDYRGIGLAAILVGRVAGRPVCVQAETTGVLSCENWDPALTRRGIAPGGMLARAMKWPLRFLYARANRFVCIARHIEDEALSEGIARDRVIYIPHGADVARFRPAGPGERDRLRQALHLPVDRPVCLYLGRLSREKGMLDLVDAWTAVSHPRAVLLVVGPDMTGHPWDVGADARRIVAERGLADRVIFHGASADPAPLFRAADIFIQPSHFEAFGISAIEAMASGLAVVASRVGGMLDFVEDEANGLLATPKDPQDFARQIRRVLDDEALRSRLAAAARETAVSRFDEARLFDKYAALVSEMASRGR
jgi:glycosyltransferase involved in cell wall biosynthesis